ncbi:MAG TPA: ABC transporter substrate-binding protein [Methanoculleus sp.]|nr:ABC transporter substrate-binding protein [Methanoculleus sp.]
MRRRVSVIALIILAAVIFACGCTGTTTTQQGTAQEIVVGVLLPLSGDYAESGEASNAALAVAAEDLNNYYASIESDYRVRLIVEDTETDPAAALEKLKELDKQGIRMVIGPGSSAELEAVRTYADEHGILIVSTMSTAPSLAIEGDNVFRFVTPDSYQADATAYFLEEDGIEAVVPIFRGDVWGDELRNLTAKAFEARNGTVLEGVRYTPGQEDYNNMVADLDVQVGRAVAAHGRDKVGVYAVTFSEIVPIMTAAAGTENLTEVRWYGSDGNILLGTLVSPGDAARFAVQTNFTGPAFWQESNGAAHETTFQKIQDRLGRQPDGYSLASYDTLWLVALAETQTASTKASEQKIALTKIANMVEGPFCDVVGLNAAGDRSTAHYCFWSVEADGDAYRWVPVAQYDTWAAGMTPEFGMIGA